MLNPRLAGRYAKSLIDLAIEKDLLEEVYRDMIYLNRLMKQSPELVSVLRSPVITEDKKLKVLDALTAGKVGQLTTSFTHLLVAKSREVFLQDITYACIEQYKEYKGIHSVTLTTAVPVSEEVTKAIVHRLQEDAGMKAVELEAVVQENIIGGFILEADGRRVDCSIAYDLANLKKKFSNNDFIYRIR